MSLIPFRNDHTFLCWTYSSIFNHLDNITLKHVPTYGELPAQVQNFSWINRPEICRNYFGEFGKHANTVPAIADNMWAIRTTVCISRSNTYVKVRTDLVNLSLCKRAERASKSGHEIMLYQRFYCQNPNKVLSRGDSKTTADFRL